VDVLKISSLTELSLMRDAEAGIASLRQQITAAEERAKAAADAIAREEMNIVSRIGAGDPADVYEGLEPLRRAQSRAETEVGLLRGALAIATRRKAEVEEQELTRLAGVFAEQFAKKVKHFHDVLELAARASEQVRALEHWARQMFGQRSIDDWSWGELVYRDSHFAFFTQRLKGADRAQFTPSIPQRRTALTGVKLRTAYKGLNRGETGGFAPAEAEQLIKAGHAEPI
jgi:hypothetical protein